MIIKKLNCCRLHSQSKSNNDFVVIPDYSSFSVPSYDSWLNGANIPKSIRKYTNRCIRQVYFSFYSNPSLVDFYASVSDYIFNSSEALELLKDCHSRISSRGGSYA